MSGDSSKRQSKQALSGQVVLPQPVTDPSIIDSVAGFIHDVVPQACTLGSNTEINRESIVWVKFGSADYNDPENFLADTECQSDSVPPLLIVLGYGSGIQVWGVSGGGEGRELLSLPQGSFRCLEILTNPGPVPRDSLAGKRPLIAFADNNSPGPPFHTLNLVSLRTGEPVKSIKFKTAILDVVSNKRSLVVTFMEKIAVFDLITLDDRMTVTTCFPSPGINPNPVALGPRWLAFCDNRLTTWKRSSGGCEDDGTQSYTATVIHAAKSLGKGLRELGGSLTGTGQQSSSTQQPGVVTIIDIEAPRNSKQQQTDDDSSVNMVAHFVAHASPIVALVFDPSGMLLVVADKHGHRFNVFRVHPHPSSPALASVHHLYILHRGDTTGRVQDMCVSWDSRWVAVSSLRGTTHVFPITPYGGPTAARTHTTPHLVNRLSRFERSSGLACSPESSPRLAPFPQPVVVAPLAQVRPPPEDLPPPRLAARFAPPRVLLPPRATPPRTPRHSAKPRVADSLFVVSSYGTLIQYDLHPRSASNVPKDKISYDTGIELCIEAKGEWVLVRPPHQGAVQPPLAPGNPLLPPGLPSSRTTLVASPQLHHPAKDDRWLSQVEIITHTGPHRRLWMGPQFSFKSLDQGSVEDDERPPVRSNPVNMPRRPHLWIESSSAGSVDAPYMTDNSDDSLHGETRLREDLADAMLESQGGCVGGGVVSQEVAGRRPSARMQDAFVQVPHYPLSTIVESSQVFSSSLGDYSASQHSPVETQDYFKETQSRNTFTSEGYLLSEENKSSLQNPHDISAPSTVEKVFISVECFTDQDIQETKSYITDTISPSVGTMTVDLEEFKTLTPLIPERKPSPEKKELSMGEVSGTAPTVMKQGKKESKQRKKKKNKNLETTPKESISSSDSKSDSSEAKIESGSCSDSSRVGEGVDVTVTPVMDVFGVPSHLEDSDVIPSDDKTKLDKNDPQDFDNPVDSFKEEEIIAIETAADELSEDRIPCVKDEIEVNVPIYEFTELTSDQLHDTKEDFIQDEVNVSDIKDTDDSGNKSDSELISQTTERKKKKKKNIELDEESAEASSELEKEEKQENTENRRQKREPRGKATSPTPIKTDDAEESSDEAGLTEKLASTKQIKRRKSTKRGGEFFQPEEPKAEKCESKSKSDGTSDLDYETCSEKKSDSSVESFFESKRDVALKSWSSIVKGGQKKPTEDRDSVYESCNDDESSTVHIQSESTIMEEKTDSGEKDSPCDTQTTSKKQKKQKKKKR